MSPLLEPADLYPRGAGTPAFTLVDVRAPVEVAAGALPFSLSQPILSDDERHQVGIRYKESGQEAAVKLGYALTEHTMPARVAGWREVAARGPTAVMCWRGGLRSQFAAEFIGPVGDAEVVRVRGGYKALRGYVMANLEASLARFETLVIGGLTGSGKTSLLCAGGRAPHIFALDLEGEAKHRGSAFGRLADPQPAQASFENSVATELLLRHEPLLLLEDESRNIGARQLPDPLFHTVESSPLVLVEVPLVARVARIHRDYVLSLSATLGTRETKTYLENSLLRLKKRLSGATVDAALNALERAHTSGAWAELGAHQGWITPLLESYYDPLYRKSLETSARPVVFSGSPEECLAWLRQYPTQ